MIAAQVEAGVVVNLVVVHDLSALPGLVDGAGAKIGDHYDGESFVTPPVTVHLPTFKAALVESVDDRIAEIYNRWLRFEAEYVAREAAARAFVDSGYVDTPGVWITAFSTAVGITNAQAADLIVSQANQLRSALQALGALRMEKYGIQSAASAAAAQGAHDAIIAQADAIAATL